MNFSHDLPADFADALDALYRGTIFQLAPTTRSLELVSLAIAAIETEVGSEMRQAQFRFSDEEFFERIGRLRKLFYTNPGYHQLVGDIVASCGGNAAALAFDPMRLRVVTHRGFENPRAAPIYYAHRDTWYAHSQAEITWWIPLHDVSPEETFVFYPDWFDRPVNNNSEAFDYDEWTRQGASKRIGWQNRDHGATQLYPGHIGELQPGEVLSFAARAGEIVLFAGAHFHQTRKQSTGQTRFSIDFRTVALNDHAKGIGAPNVDNRSRGSALRDYVQPGSLGN